MHHNDAQTEISWQEKEKHLLIHLLHETKHYFRARGKKGHKYLYILYLHDAPETLPERIRVASFQNKINSKCTK